MVDSASFQHVADIYFSKSVYISVCGVYQISRTYCQVFFISHRHIDIIRKAAHKIHFKKAQSPQGLLSSISAISVLRAALQKKGHWVFSQQKILDFYQKTEPIY